jgi:hypothetical protein
MCVRFSMCQYSETNVVHILFNVLRIKSSTCYEHYMLIFKRRYTNGTWYTACVVCQLVASGFGVERTQYTKCRLCRAS